MKSQALSLKQTGHDLPKHLLELALEEFQGQIDETVQWLQNSFPSLYHRLLNENDRLLHLFEFAARRIQMGQQTSSRVNLDHMQKHLFFSSADLSEVRPYLLTEGAEFSPSHLSFFLTQNQTTSILSFWKKNDLAQEPFDFHHPIYQQWQKSFEFEKKNQKGFSSFWGQWKTPQESDFQEQLSLQIPRQNLLSTTRFLLKACEKFQIHPQALLLWNPKKANTPSLLFAELLLSQNLTEKIKQELLFEIRCFSFLPPFDPVHQLETTLPHLGESEKLGIRCMAQWITVIAPLSDFFPSGASYETVLRRFRKTPDLLGNLAQLFLKQFCDEKRNSDHSLHSERNFLKQQSNSLTPQVKFCFQQALLFLDGALRTNFYESSSSGLAFYLHPPTFQQFFHFEVPFGLYFIVSEEAIFLHNRFQNVARGGMRLIHPSSQEDFDARLNQLLQEVEGLSWAQELKNAKDIPEGGAKATCLIHPDAPLEPSAKIILSGFLDLLIPREEPSPADRLNRQETIYLGPDENVSPDLIEWLFKTSEERKLPNWKTIISSKPDFGINHKDYGVTSEGLFVYLDYFVKKLKLGEKQPLRIKLTGGPRGDVTGNLLKIIHREWGTRPQIVALIDSRGAAFDPEGLNWDELLRLVEEEKSIYEFNSEKLSQEERAFVLHAQNPSDRLIKDQLLFKVVADVFLPCGGRPYTINEKNVHQFFQENGQLTFSTLIEGANIFLTKEARSFLENQGVLIIKDSSANKTGVICSSYEILAGSLLSPQEFAELKDRYVEEVLIKLKEAAFLEAKTLETLVEQGEACSYVDASDLISKKASLAFKQLKKNAQFGSENWISSSWCKHVLKAYIPPTLREEKWFSRLRDLPQDYLKATVLTFLAGRWIYQNKPLEQIPLTLSEVAEKILEKKELS